MEEKLLKEAKQETLRFLARVKELEGLKSVRNHLGKTAYDDVMNFGGVETAAVKRASMDLSRVLSKLRRGGPR
jgi:hypothetical protein